LGYQQYGNAIKHTDNGEALLDHKSIKAVKQSLSFFKVIYSKNINAIIKSLLPLIEADAILENKYIKVELTEIPNFILNNQEIRQLILNLVRNSLDSMSPGGYLTIKTYIEDDEIILAIKDQGTGLVPEVLNKIGIPFFTTKEQGRGLGLALCFNIAASHNAVITVETSDKGTTFFTRFANGDSRMVHAY